LLLLLPPMLAAADAPPSAAPAALPADTVGEVDPMPFGAPGLDLGATGKWWEHIAKAKPNNFLKAAGLDVPRDQVIAFALYTHDHGVLKLTAQLYPLKPGEPSVVRLELQRDGQWAEVARTRVVYPGWSAHFRLENWDATKTVAYRVRHGEAAVFEGVLRRDPVDKNEIVVAVMSCNGTADVRVNPHVNTVANLRKLDPDLLFFCGDQHYRHSEHTAGWIIFGRDFRDILRDRPTVTIPDDHDVGHGNLWGEEGKVSKTAGNDDGGYKYPAAYVNMVQRQQTWHLPDAWDPAPIGQGITVYFTRLRVGGVDLAILEDRKFKTGPNGRIPRMGPRPDHITDPKYDPKTVDLPGLKLLGDRQMKFLADWGQDWTGAEIKAVGSATAFCGAVHIHGKPDAYLLADLDCNGWPQTGRNDALRALRRVAATHLCGDQHLAVVVKHGIDADADGPYALTAPALFNSIYGRWWKPQDGKPGANPVSGSPLEWTGDFRDGLGNRIRMPAYANPSFDKVRPEKDRADGFALARFDKAKRTVRFECWSRFADVTAGDKAQFPGWPMTLSLDDNDGRKVFARLPETDFGSDRPVVAVIDEATGEVISVRRLAARRATLPVFAPGKYTLKAGADRPDAVVKSGIVVEGDR
jgi:hypothetical protein